MTNENETVEQVCDWLTERDMPFAASIAEVKIKNPHYDAEACMIDALKNLSDRAEAAHKREIAAKDAEIESMRRTVKYYEGVVSAKCKENESSRTLIKELADALDAFEYTGYYDIPCARLVEKAREVISK